MGDRSTYPLQGIAPRQRFRFLGWQLLIDQGSSHFFVNIFFLVSLITITVNFLFNMYSLLIASATCLYSFIVLRVYFVYLSLCTYIFMLNNCRVYPIREGGRILELIYSSKQFKTKGGLTTGTATTHYFASQEFKIKQEKTKSFTCSPEEVISSGDYKQSNYCHLLLGLLFSNQVEFITSTFAYSIVQAFSTFEEQWQELCNDIREGTLSPRINIPEVRKAVLEIISPNPSLASKIEGCCQELQNLDWCGLISRLWPNAKYVYSIMTGSMQHYLKKLRHYAGELPLVSADYGSTESWIGVNVDPYLPPEKVTFAVVPTFSYYEFIPLYRQKEDCHSAIDDFIEDKPVPLSHVKLGQQYEIVLTTFTGKSF